MADSASGEFAALSSLVLRSTSARCTTWACCAARDEATRSAIQSAEVVAIIIQGPRAMPSFATRLSAEEIDAVVRYTREVL